MKIKILLAALALAGTAVASPYKAPNCAAQSPPAKAGEQINGGTQVKVFPRKSDMGKAYSGCQVAWASNQGNWELLGVTLFEKGEVTGFWIPPGETWCDYKGGKASGTKHTGTKATSCPPAASLLLRSMPAGCTQKILGRAGTEGCAYD